MPAPLLSQLSMVAVSEDAAERLRLAAGPLELRRAWPGGAGELTLEYVDGRGQVLAGQWRSDPGELRRVLNATVAVAPTATVLEGVSVVLQAWGADARLKCLAELARMPETRLIGHRAERRAVLHHEEQGVATYLKVLPPKKVAGVLERWGIAARAAAGHVNVPRLASSDPDQGILRWEALAGEPLHECLGSPALPEHSRALGAALRGLHGADPGDLPRHSAADEAAVLRQWHERLGAFDAELAGVLAAAVNRTVGELQKAGGPGDAVIHRDLHDKQVFVGRAVGMLDFDLVARGESEVDLGNWVAHMQLRALQGLLPPAAAAQASEAFLAGYGAHDAGRLALYTRSAVLRLACVYAFRPRWSHLSARLGESAARAAVEAG